MNNNMYIPQDNDNYKWRYKKIYVSSQSCKDIKCNIINRKVWRLT